MKSLTAKKSSASKTRSARSLLRLVFGRGLTPLLTLALGLAALPHLAWSETITLNSGVQLEGKVGEIGKISQNLMAAATGADTGGVKEIVIVNDNMRRVYLPAKQVRSVAPSSANVEERIKIDNLAAAGGKRIGSVGSIIAVQPFDEFGRRTVSMNSNLGRIDIVQGITLITPHYTKVEAMAGSNPIIWDTRIATNSIPRQTLSRVIRHSIDEKNPEERLSIVRLYTQSQRFHDAREELAEVLKDFPEMEKLKKELGNLWTLEANRAIDEIKLRRDSGQYNLAFNMAKSFPRPDPRSVNVSLGAVNKILLELERINATGTRVKELLDKHLAELPDESQRLILRPLCEEMKAELNVNTLNRMADYLRLADDEEMTPDQKLSLAISGWVLGSGSGVENLAVSRSLFAVRDLVREYLSEPRAAVRDEILARLLGQEGSTPGYLAKIIANMKPPVETNADPLDDMKGMYQLSTPGLTGEPDIQYYIQLPPEYDPNRRYPCVVTLSGVGTTPLQQVSWWAGDYNPKLEQRMGQASRHGYVVISPVWAREAQTKYEYSAREHAAVLYSLRDAMRRASIDSDRVFLSGHSMGGDAAWDIGMAHPDVFAGVIPIVAVADRYVDLYHDNAKYVPFYFVMGEMDGDKLAQNARSFDRYLPRPGYDVMMVEYQGRGHEHFHDEILAIFDWMGKHKRNFFPREFEDIASMRPWDNFFWWAELSEFPEKSMVAPVAWSARRVPRAALTTGKILENNGVSLASAAEKAIVYLSPEMVNFEDRIYVNGKAQLIKPSAEVLLEDVRTRGDRQHPFWAKVECKPR